jgi:hypothetical protein
LGDRDVCFLLKKRRRNCNNVKKPGFYCKIFVFITNFNKETRFL